MPGRLRPISFDSRDPINILVSALAPPAGRLPYLSEHTMHAKLAVAGVLMTFLSGCSLLSGTPLDQDSYFDELAETTCKVNKDCFKAYYESEWDDLEECVDDHVDLLDDAKDYYEDCDFDEDQAKACLDAMRGAECGEFLDEGDAEDIADECDYEEIFDCD